VTRYFLRWRERRHCRQETFGFLVLERILTPEVMAWLADPDPEIMQGLLAAVAGIDDGAVLSPIGLRGRPGERRAGPAREPHRPRDDIARRPRGPLSARRHAPAGPGGRWQINAPSARLWLLPGIPRDPDSLADILLERVWSKARGPLRPTRQRRKPGVAVKNTTGMMPVQGQGSSLHGSGRAMRHFLAACPRQTGA
jgi:conjugal transfer pilus assembly protein TraI